MDFYKWVINQQVMLMVPITLSVERVAKIFDNRVRVLPLIPTQDTDFFFITHPTSNLPDNPLCHSLVAPFLNFKEVTWFLGVPQSVNQGIVVNDSYTATGEYENNVIICETENITRLKEALDFNQKPKFQVYIKYKKVYDYVRTTEIQYKFFTETSSVLYPGDKKSLLVHDRNYPSVGEHS